MTEASFNPFADDVTAATFGALSVENGRSSILVHGDMTIGRTADDLVAIRSLIGLLEKIEASIIAGVGEEGADEASSVDEIDNPF